MKRLLAATAAALMTLNLSGCGEPATIDSVAVSPPAASGEADLHGGLWGSASLWDEHRSPGLSTDGDGAGSVTVSYAAEPGDHVLNVNVVAYSGGAAGQDDPRPREIGPDAFAKLTVPGERVVQTLYGDGDIRCPDHWAHDLSLPVGTVQYQPGESGIEITVTLDQAWPDTEYYVEVNTDAFCAG